MTTKARALFLAVVGSGAVPHASVVRAARACVEIARDVDDDVLAVLVAMARARPMGLEGLKECAQQAREASVVLDAEKEQKS